VLSPLSLRSSVSSIGFRPAPQCSGSGHQHHRYPSSA
jgi:hypothetical protein